MGNHGRKPAPIPWLAKADGVDAENTIMQRASMMSWHSMLGWALWMHGSRWYFKSAAIMITVLALMSTTSVLAEAIVSMKTQMAFVRFGGKIAIEVDTIFSKDRCLVGAEGFASFLVMPNSRMIGRSGQV